MKGVTVAVVRYKSPLLCIQINAPTYRLDNVATKHRFISFLTVSCIFQSLLIGNLVFWIIFHPVWFSVRFQCLTDHIIMENLSPISTLRRYYVYNTTASNAKAVFVCNIWLLACFYVQQTADISKLYIVFIPRCIH